MAGRVLIGLSGGVDSTLAAILLKEQGYEVIGASMSIYNADIPNLLSSGNACYGAVEKPEIKDIALLGEKIGIKTYKFDCSEEYKKTILSYFKDAYSKGITPNPCVMCNAIMKFGLLCDKAVEEGIAFDYFATGHYVQKSELNGRIVLKKGVDEKKDQSYFLYRLSQEQLKKVIFPLGGMTKEKVRLLAKEKGLDVADKADSQDFYAGDYADLLQFKDKDGIIMHVNGTVLGHHKGYWHYTVGQRKGLGVSYKEPLFVLDVDADKNIVYVGTASDMNVKECFVSDLNWLAFENLSSSIKAMAKQRSTAKPVSVLIEPLDGKVRIIFDEPQKSVTAGQSMVFYDGDIVLGGGIIEKNVKAL